MFMTLGLKLAQSLRSNSTISHLSCFSSLILKQLPLYTTMSTPRDFKDNITSPPASFPMPCLKQLCVTQCRHLLEITSTSALSAEGMRWTGWTKAFIQVPSAARPATNQLRFSCEQRGSGVFTWMKLLPLIQQVLVTISTTICGNKLC